MLLVHFRFISNSSTRFPPSLHRKPHIYNPHYHCRRTLPFSSPSTTLSSHGREHPTRANRPRRSVETPPLAVKFPQHHNHHTSTTSSRKLKTTKHITSSHSLSATTTPKQKDLPLHTTFTLRNAKTRPPAILQPPTAGILHADAAREAIAAAMA